MVTYDERKATTTNPPYGDEAEAEVDALLAQPFGNWHVETTDETLQLRVTKKGRRSCTARPRRTSRAPSTTALPGT